MLDGQEMVSSPVLPDSDLDGVLDGAEPAGDIDGDGLPNVLDPDSDNDGLRDGVEVRICGTITCANPLGDADGDLVNNLDEVSIFTDPLDADSDDDGLTDGSEVLAGTDPLVPDRTPPVPVLTDPAAGTQVVRGDSIVIAASATDDGRVTRVEFFVDGQRIGTDFTLPYSAAFAVPDSSQPLTLEVRATDTNANTGSTGPVTVGVRPDPLTAVTGTVVDAAGVVVAEATAEVRLAALALESGETAIDGGAMAVDPNTNLGTSTLMGSMTFEVGDRGFLDTVVDLEPADPLMLTGTLMLDFNGNNPASPTPRSGTLVLSGTGGSGLGMQVSGPITGILPVTAVTPVDLELAVSAFEAGGVLTAQPLEGREVTVRLQGTLEIVADPGTSNITAATLEGDVVVIVHPALSATTGVDGRFSIQQAPSIYGSLIVDARFAEPGRPVLSGASAPAA
ncbi:MAG: Ig-like domain-containing protein, partial [Actinomycetota bacterium]